MKSPFRLHSAVVSSLALVALALSACQSLPLHNAQAPFLRPRGFGPVLRAQSSLPQNMQVYYGNLHSHTSYSDGILTPREAYRMAEGNGLDFMAVTEHNHRYAAGDDGIYLTPQLYEDLKKTAHEFTRNGKFVALYGQEFSTISSGNHVNIFEADSIVDVRNGDFKTLYEKWLPQHPEVPFIQFNHPNFERDMGIEDDTRAHFNADELAEESLHAHAFESFADEGSKRFNDYGYDDYNRDFRALSAAANPYVRTLEILNGPGTRPRPLPKVDAWHEKDYFHYLNQGFRIAPSADQDNHHAHWGSLSPARTGIIAPALTRQEVYKAFRARRVFASEDKNLALSFQANGQWMGSELPYQPQLHIDVQVRDSDEADALYTLQLFADTPGQSTARPIYQKQFQGDQQISWTWAVPPGASQYLFAKVTQTNPDGKQDEAWTAPVWVD